MIKIKKKSHKYEKSKSERNSTTSDKGCGCGNNIYKTSQQPFSESSSGPPGGRPPSLPDDFDNSFELPPRVD